MITDIDRRLMRLAEVPKELEDAVRGGAYAPRVMNVRLSAAWNSYRSLQPRMGPTDTEDKVSQLSTLDPSLMTDAEFLQHFEFPSPRSEAIEAEVQRRLSAPAPRTGLTEADREVAAQLGIPVGDFERRRREERAEAPESEVTDQAAVDLAKNFGGKPEDYYDAIREGKGD